jgi:hypothetical protein
MSRHPEEYDPHGGHQYFIIEVQLCLFDDKSLLTDCHDRAEDYVNGLV